MTIVGPDSGPVAGGLAQVSPAAIPRAVAPLPSPAGGGAPRFAAQPQPSAQPAAPRAPQGQVMANVGGPAAMPQFDGEPAAKPAVKTVVPPKQPVKKANPATPSAQPGAVAKPRPGGFVAVLGYQRSQIEAMKMLADLQQKYDVLRDKRLDVVESDQSARGLGTIYRVVVGPAGGGEAARNLCAQLVAAGHPKADCYTLSN